MILNALIALILTSTCAQPDTIDYWHVRYNGKLIKEYNANVYQKIIRFKSTQIKTNDIISVAYGNDTPCSSCETELILSDSKKRKHSLTKGKGTFKPLTFSLSDAQKTGGKVFDIYFHDAYNRTVYLFTIKIE